MKNSQKVNFSLFFKVVKEFLIIFTIYAIGEGLMILADSKFPGSVVGMLLLLFSLHVKWIKVEDIRIVSSFLLGYMPLFFIPAGVSVMVTYTLMEGFYLQIVFIIMLSTLVVMASTAWVVQLLVEWEKRK